VAGEYDQLIAQAAAKYNIDPDIFRRLLMRESQLNPRAVNPTSGAAGIAQFMPATARGLGIDPLDPAQAIPASAQYVRQNLNQFGGDYSHALAAYNWGPGNVASKGLAAAPAETRAYIANILHGSAPMAAGGAPPTAPDVNPPAPTAPPVGSASQPAALDLALLGQQQSQGGTLGDMFMAAAKRAQGLA
jgi:hypothetical protein